MLYCRHKSTIQKYFRQKIGQKYTRLVFLIAKSINIRMKMQRLVTAVPKDAVIEHREISALCRIAEKFRFFGYFLGICTGFLRRLVSVHGCQLYKCDLAQLCIQGSETAFGFRDRFHGSRRVTLMLTYLPSQLLDARFMESRDLTANCI